MSFRKTMEDQFMPVADPGWYIKELISTISFSDTSTWLEERWSIVADAPLDELFLELNLDEPTIFRLDPTRPPTDPIEAVIDVQGADLTVEPWSASAMGRPVVGIWLPSPLGPGDRHDFGLMMRISGAPRITRHLVRSSVPCRRLEVRLHLPRLAAHSTVGRVESPAGQSVSTAGETARDLAVNRAGETAAIFHDLRPGMTYGLSWGTHPTTVSLTSEL